MKRMIAGLCVTLVLLSACVGGDKIICTVTEASTTTTTASLTKTPVITIENVVTTAPTVTTTIVTTSPIITVPIPEPEDDAIVNVADYFENVKVDLKYATEENFTKKQIYLFEDAYLRYGTVKKLMLAAELLEAEGYGIIIWDAYRPTAAQFRLWEICPDPTYVADPNKKFSSHSRGNTVDISLYRLSDGADVEMPTGFDDFTDRADRDYSDVEKELADRAIMLENIMKDCGFKPYSGEWWHFSDSTTYDVEKGFLSDMITSDDAGK